MAHSNKISVNKLTNENCIKCGQPLFVCQCNEHCDCCGEFIKDCTCSRDDAYNMPDFWDNVYDDSF